MNERIQKLRLQAWYYADDNSHDGDGKHGQLYAEKFAELIVAECAMVIERNLFQGIGWNTSRAVKRHFGIGEEE